MTSLLQGEAVAVEEKPSFSLLDKIRGKRHSSADHPAAVPSTPSGKRHPSFELGQVPTASFEVASGAGTACMSLSTSWAKLASLEPAVVQRPLRPGPPTPCRSISSWV